MKKIKKIIALLLSFVVMWGTVPNVGRVLAAYSALFPVKDGTIAYYYGYTEAYGGNHTGIDIHSTGNDNIYAALPGRVVAIANSCPHISIYPTKCEHYNTYGNYIKIQHDDGAYSYYGHLKQNSIKVSVGQSVSKGQLIAVMGSSGYSSGKHLHFEMRYSDGTTKINVNPTSMGGEIVYEANTSTPPVPYTNVTEGDYYIKNKGNGEYLTIQAGIDAEGQRVHTYPYTEAVAVAQTHKVYKVSDGYEIMPFCTITRVINPYAWSVVSGKTVNLYSKTNESSQWWKFQKVGDAYVIRNVQNPNVCLANASSDDVSVETYTGASSQLWYLEKYCTVKFDANGGSGAPSSQRICAGKKLTAPTQKPTKKCASFVGWSTVKNSTTANVKAGGTITISKDTTLYAVWAGNHNYAPATYTAPKTCRDCGATSGDKLKQENSSVSSSNTSSDTTSSKPSSSGSENTTTSTNTSSDTNTESKPSTSLPESSYPDTEESSATVGATDTTSDFKRPTSDSTDDEGEIYKAVEKSLMFAGAFVLVVAVIGGIIFIIFRKKIKK